MSGIDYEPAVEWQPVDVDTGMTRAEDQTIGDLPPDVARRLDERLRENARARARGMASAMTYFVYGAAASGEEGE